MVVYLARRIKMGGGMGEARTCAAGSSPCQPEHQKERAVQLFRRLRVDAANNSPNAVAPERDQFVCHDLRPKAKTVLGCNLDQRSERKSVLQVRRNRTDEDRRKAGVEFVTLNDDAGPRPPEIARNDHQHDIAPRYFHDSQSYTDSIQSSIASFSGCCAISFISRRISASTLGSRKSGTQCCTGRSPCARSRSRREAMRCCGVRGFDFFGVVAMGGA
jgi:hypothetical protein